MTQPGVVRFGAGAASALFLLAACSSNSNDTSPGASLGVLSSAPLSAAVSSSAAGAGAGAGAGAASAFEQSAAAGGGDGGTAASGDAVVSGDTVLGSAWLGPSQLPIGSGLQWQAGPAAPQVNANPENNLGSCLTGNPLQVGAGATWQTEGGIFHQAGSTQAKYQVYQVQYFYSGSSSAARGLSAIETAYDQCKQSAAVETGVVDTIKVTRQSADTYAVLRTVRTSGGAPTSTPTVGSDSHEYFVQDGNVVYFVGLYGDSGIDGSSQDAGLMSRMLAAVSGYWS